jgi:hypothetical protein
VYVGGLIKFVRTELAGDDYKIKKHCLTASFHLHSLVRDEFRHNFPLIVLGILGGQDAVLACCSWLHMLFSLESAEL